MWNNWESLARSLRSSNQDDLYIECDKGLSKPAKIDDTANVQEMRG